MEQTTYNIEAKAVATFIENLIHENKAMKEYIRFLKLDANTYSIAELEDYIAVLKASDKDEILFSNRKQFFNKSTITETEEGVNIIIKK